MNIHDMRILCHNRSVIVTQHCMNRMAERGITLSKVEQTIMDGELIEVYPDDYPYPSGLILGRGLHVVSGIDDGYLWLITAYNPDPDQWESDLKTRRAK